MSKKTKYYVVWEGKTKGIFGTWAEAEKQVKGVDGAKFQSFDSLPAAQAAFKMDFWAFKNMEKKAGLGANSPISKTVSKTKLSIEKNPLIEKNAIAVDAACSGNPGDMEYRGVILTTAEQLFHVGPLAQGTNNIGEYLAIVHALAMLKKQNREDVTIYTDSKTALAWVRNRRPKTQLERTAKNEKIFELLERATDWLQKNTFKNPIVKWETEDWGEIPADFGRK